MSETKKRGSPASDFGALLDARGATLITLVMGELQLVVHRSILVTRSPVFAAMLAHDMVEGSSGRIVIADIEPEVMRQLVLFMYKDCAPELCSMASQLLVAADKYCMSDLKAQSELQMNRELSVENVVTSALVVLRHSCPRLKEVCGSLIQGNFTKVMLTKGWAEAVSKHPEEFVEISRLIAAKPSKTRCESQENIDQKLLRAAESGMHMEVSQLLSTGANVGARDRWGRTALHYAAFSGNEKTTVCLLEAGAPVDARDRWLQTPLHTAIQACKWRAIGVLVAASKDVNTADVHGDTPLHLAAQSCDGSVVQALLQAGADKGVKNNRGETPLHVAELCEKQHMLELLSVSDTDSVSGTNEDQKSLASDLGTLLEGRDAALVTLVVGGMKLALHRSVLVARSSVFAEMLAHDTTERSSSRIVISDVEPKVMRQLVSFMYKDTAPELCSMAPQLLAAADKYCIPELKSQCELQLVRELSVENVMSSALLALRHSCPRLKEAAGCFLKANFTRVVSTEGWADAVRNCPEEFLEFGSLLATIRGAPQEERNQKLLEAAERHNSTEAKKLLATGADVDARDLSGKTALHIAAGSSFGWSDVIILLQAGADVEARDESGKTALHYAAATGCEATTDSLLRAGARVDARDRWLRTPLHAAIMVNRWRTVGMLLGAASDVNTADVRGDTPLHLAARRGDVRVIEALLKAGADKGARNDRQETPLHVAERFNRGLLIDWFR